MNDDFEVNLDRVLGLVAESRRILELTSGGDSPPVSFLREGEHILRFSPDSDGELLRIVGIHRRGKFKTHCPNYLRQFDPAADYPVCEICPLAARRNDWRLRMQQLTLCYGYLCQTSHESQFWQPGRTYVVVGNTQMYQAFCAMLESLSTSDQKTLTSMLTPQVPGPGTLVTVKKGLQGYVTMEPLTDEQFPPIALGRWYKQLQYCWIWPDFSIAHYQALLLQLKTE